MSESFYNQLDIIGDRNLGLYGFATDSYCLTGQLKKKENHVEKTLGVEVFETKIMELDLIKLFITGNSSLAFVPDILYQKDIERIEHAISKKVEVVVLETEKAVGNMILMNDNGIVLSPMVRNLKQKVEKHSGLEAEISTIAGLSVIGSAGLATNKGCLLHPSVTQSEVKKIEKILNVSAEIGTVAFGSHYPGSGIIANSNGFLTSTATSGPELGRIAEALKFVE